MAAQETKLPQHLQVVVDRFVAACQADERVVAAFLAGSYARGTADAYSDLDLCVITTDAAYEAFFAQREAFLRQLGEPIFLEDYHGSGVNLVCFMFAGGAEGELVFGRESDFQHMHEGPYTVLLDKKQLLADVVFAGYRPDRAEQIETLHGLISWFWHDLSHHFITPLARGHLWGAYGALEDLRHTCVNLTRLRQNFAVEAEGYEKVEQAIPIEQLLPLQATCCPLECEAMLQAIFVIVHFYQEVAPPLAQAHGIPYPAELERVMYARLEQLRGASQD